MTKSRERSSRSGSDPVVIGTTKLNATDSGDLKILDTSDNRKKIIASELHIGDGSNQIILKKDSSTHKIVFETQAGDSTPASSNAGGGVTVVANTTALQALSGSAEGDLAFVTATKKLMLRTSTGWYTVSTVTNASPVISSAGNASYDFATDGTPIVITVSASEPESETITYAHQVTSGSASGIATITQGTGGNVNQFTLTPQQSGSGGTFSVKFSATDPNSNVALSSASAFTLTFSVQASAIFDGSNDKVSISGSNDFDLADGAISIECWGYFDSFIADPGWWTPILEFGTNANHKRFSVTWDDGSGGGRKIGLFCNTTSSTNINLAGTTVLQTGTWYHLCWVRNSSGTWKLYVNGTQEATGSETGTMGSNASASMSIGWGEQYGDWLDGKISNLRIVKGTEVYTSNFTPSSVNLDKITNTKLLTFNDPSTIEDDSDSNHTMTVSGATASSTGPF